LIGGDSRSAPLKLIKFRIYQKIPKIESGTQRAKNTIQIHKMFHISKKIFVFQNNIRMKNRISMQTRYVSKYNLGTQIIEIFFEKNENRTHPFPVSTLIL
jgi:hypothetical protein